jgi:hypothetical protein
MDEFEPFWLTLLKAAAIAVVFWFLIVVIFSV